MLKSKEELGEEEVNALLPVTDSIDFHKRMIAENIQVIQKGDFSHDSQMAVLEIVENNIQVELNESEVIQTTYRILQKMLKNIDKHGLDVGGKKEGIFLLAKQNSHYIISTGNYIAEDKIEALEKRLEYLNKAKLENTLAEDKEKRIGFIEMAKVSKDTLSYSFDKAGDNKYFFSLSVTV